MGICVKMRSDVHMKAILALLAAIVLEVSGGVSIIIPKDYVANLCQKNCQQSTEKPLVDQSERGCRFFDLAQTSDLLDLNITNVTSLCVDSCKEAYENVNNEDMCVLGCNNAKEAINIVEKKANELLEEAKNQMIFLKIMITISSVSLVFLSLLMACPNQTIWKNANNDVEILTLIGDELGS